MCIMKVLALNRRAKHDYSLLQHYTAGLVLAGHEVKSVKAGQISLKGSFVHLNQGEAFLVNAHIRQYSHARNLASYEPTRPRKLLLQRKELEQLQEAKHAQGLTIVPTAVGVQRGLVKLEIALGRGKKRYDKRQAAREATMKREAQLEAKRL